MGRYIIVGVLAFIIVVGAGSGTVWFMMNRMTSGVTSTANQPESASGALDPKVKVVDIGKFVTNLADQEERRFIDVSFSVVVKDEKDAKKIDTNQTVIRDAVLTLLTATASDEVIGPDGAETLKTMVQDKLNEVLGGQIIQRILITHLVVQF